MTTAVIPVQLPEPLFQRLKRAAELTHRSVEEIAATTLAAALPLAPDAPPEIAHELTAMHLFSDEALWAATAPSLSPTEETRLTQLNSTATARALTGAEQAEQHRLLTPIQNIRGLTSCRIGLSGENSPMVSITLDSFVSCLVPLVPEKSRKTTWNSNQTPSCAGRFFQSP